MHSNLIPYHLPKRHTVVPLQHGTSLKKTGHGDIKSHRVVVQISHQKNMAKTAEYVGEYVGDDPETVGFLFSFGNRNSECVPSHHQRKKYISINKNITKNTT